MDETFTSIQEATAISAMFAATHLAGVKAIVALTESGSTAKLMSRINTALPIFSLSRHHESRSRCALYRGVYPIAFDSTKSKPHELVQDAINEIKLRGHVAPGDVVILTHGDVMETVGSTNTCKIIEVT